MNETIHTIGGCRLNKTEIDILQYIRCTPDICSSWRVMSLADNTNTFFDDAVQAVDTLVLEGLLHNDTDTFVSPTDTERSVIVSSNAFDWLDEHTEELNSLYIMLDTSVFDDSETAVA